MPVSWMEHRGQRILYIDYRKLRPAACLDTLREHHAAVEAASGPVLALVDARGAVFSSEFVQAAKTGAPRMTERTLKRAIVGAEGLKEVLLMGFNMAAGPVPMKSFATVEEALAYLTEP